MFCLCRSSDGLLPQTDGKNKSTQLISSRITFLAAELPRVHRGLGWETDSKSLEEATLVIHNAGAVNVNLSLLSFRPQLTALVNRIEPTSLATTSP